MSKVHADCVASNRPDLKYCALEEPISVTSADSKSDLKAVATMQIPITWENQTETVFTMLVVPGLVWPMLFGENHLHATQALVDHYAPSITFRHPSMQFRVQCSLDNPLQGFANISVPNSSSSCESGSTAQKPHVSITCLLTGAPPLGVNKHSQSLHRGLNFVTVCVTLSAALMGYQVIRQPLWIEGKDIQPGVKVLSGPFDLSQISSNVTPEIARPSSDPCYNAQLIDLAETPESVLTEETPDMHITYCTTLAVESKLKKTSIPENVILGNVRDMTKDDDAVLEEAADTTAKQLADGWLTWANTQQPPPSLQTPKDTEHKHCDLDFCAPKQWQLSVQVKEMEDSGLNSSILSPFCDALPEFDCQGPEFPPAEELTCDPYSSAYSDAIFHALDLDGPYTVIGHVHGRQDLLRLRHKFTQDEIKTVNIEKIIVVPDELSEEVDYDLRNNEEPPSNTETVTPPELPTLKSAAIDPDLAKLAFAFGQYLSSLPSGKAYASEACKVVYQTIPEAQDILKRCGN